MPPPVRVPEPPRNRWLRRGMAAGFGAVAVVHVLVPTPFEHLIPDELPGSPAIWNLVAAGAEGLTAALLIRRRTARLGGWLAVGVLVGVLPGNIEAVRQGGYTALPGLWGSRAIAIARLPLQLPLIWLAWRVARDRSG